MNSEKSWLILFIAILIAGCSSSVQPDGKNSYTGTVTWNGVPLPAGALTVYSEQGAADGAEIHNGAFSIRTMPGQKTISVVAEREIGTPPPTERIPDPTPVKFQYLPESVNSASILKVDFSADPALPVSIELKGKEREPSKDALQPSES